MKFEFEVVATERQTVGVDASTTGRNWGETVDAAWREAELAALLFAGPARSEGASVCVRMKSRGGAQSLSDWREFGPDVNPADAPAL
ncbi:MAG: hypothetical protein J6K25_14235 [Thermoguttaceae bacterium]|nr:hypothetical protein [Thermoguttaceae bacterium]